MAERPIFILGIQRGGTNQITNLLNSHPDTYWPEGEFHQAIRKDRSRKERLPGLMRVWRRHAPRWLRRRSVLSPSRRVPGPGVLSGHLGRAVHAALRDSCAANRARVMEFKRALQTEGLIPILSEPDRMMTKLMSYNLALVPDLRALYPGAVFVGVIRDGRAVCEGNIARGISLEAAVETYDFVGRRLIALQAAGFPLRTWRFEDLLADAEAVAREIYAFCGLDAAALRGVCLHDKHRITDDDGTVLGMRRDVRFYTFAEMARHMRTDANAQSLARLPDAARAEIEARCGTVLAHFGYA